MIENKTLSYAYETVENDLLQVLKYQLSNGLTLFLSVNPTAPRIFTNIAVRAGSKQDPPETTGLAHYMEHMLFKGTSRIGATNWEAEKKLLSQISDLYEKYRATRDEDERQQIYKEIDRLSFEAAKLVAPNEYDKLSSAIGAKHTNAYTWVEQTVYLNEIPGNELERWFQLESERFRMMALRLFHTELETVYEEFNINQDRDFRKVNQTIREVLFPSHPYGTQTTIGSPKDLRNPSQENIQRYFQTYYVPNNMAIILAGDFNPDDAVRLAEKYFGSYQARPIPPFTFEEQPLLQKPVEREVYGQEAQHVVLAWRFGSSQTNDPLLLSLLQHVMYNQQAGMLDLYLNQEQKVLEAEAWSWFYEDYSVFGLYGKPRENQTLEQVKALLLEQIEKLKSGDFEDWLIEACLKDFKLGDLRSSESNQARTDAITTSFILGIPWERYTHRIEWLETLSKEAFIQFVRENLQDNFVCVYKREGDDPKVVKVEKPPITSIELNRDAQSEYAQSFLKIDPPQLEPVFVDFQEEISATTLSNGLQLDHVHNPLNPIFRLNYIFEMGKNNDRKLSLALLYLPYLGTDRYSPAQLQQAFFRLGLHFEVHNNDERSYITLQGLEESLEEGVALFEHLLAQVQPNMQALENMMSDIISRRIHAKQDRNFVLRNGLVNYARYGAHSPFTWRFTPEELKAIQPEELTTRIRDLSQYEHRLYYYGQKGMNEVKAILEKLHKVPENRRPIVPGKVFIQIPTEKNEVLFLDFPIVQTDVMLVSRGTPHFNLEEHLMAELYNNYFGYGLSSIVFQEIRESKALAYSTFAYYSSPSKKEHAHYLQAYVGTQPDKLSDAIPAMLNILNEMPVSESQIDSARKSILRQIETDRIHPSEIYWTYRSKKDQGLDRDTRRDMYHLMQTITVEQLLDFHHTYVKNRPYTFLVMGNKEHIDLDYLGQFGPLRELSMEEVFGY